MQPLRPSLKPLPAFLQSRPTGAHLCGIIVNMHDMNKTETERKKELARALFMSGTPQEEIADKVGVSRVTISKWSSAEGWKEARAARNITRPELVNKLLATIDRLIEQVSASDDADQLAGLGDKLAKLASVIQKLDKQANVVDAIEVFMAFNKWLQYRSATDPEVTPELMKAINRYQDKFLSESINKNSLL
jgi:transposase